MAAPHLVVLCDEPAHSPAISRALRECLPEGATVSMHDEPGPALRALGTVHPDVFLIARHDVSPLPVLEAARRLAPSAAVIVVAAAGAVEIAVNALKAGAADVLTTPLRETAVVASVRRALAERARPENQEEGRPILGESESVRRMLAVARQAASSRASVLIEGESGTGKGVLAEYLHRNNPLQRGAFVKINCTAIPEGLLEAELFGYEPGAFTGAVRQKKGRVEVADGGTLFLDEIGIAPLTLQAKLLRFLQDGEFERLGGIRTLRVQTRVVSATNTNLKAAIGSGQLREDLFYRLDVIHIRVPPLRERKEDVPLLARAFLEDAARRNGRDVPRMQPEAMEALVRHRWPGNVRELQNLMERLVVLSCSGIVGIEDLPVEMHSLPRARSITVPVGVPLREVERVLMDETLRATGGDKKLAAQLLGVHPRTIYRHLEGKSEDATPETVLPETSVEGGAFFA